VRILTAVAAANPFFRTPSKNIYCAYFGTLRCDIRSGLKPMPARPPGCDFDWGQTVVLGRSGLLCFNRADHGFFLSRARWYRF
jgi:hypothetical protein